MATSRQHSGHEQGMLYTVNEWPPWYLSILLGFQQFLTCFGATFTFPIIVSDTLCITGDGEGMAQLISTIMFISGLSTLLQSTFGVRLPIIQGISYSFLVPIFVVMELDEDNCPYDYPEKYNVTALPPKGSDYHRDIWHDNVSELGGSLIVASLLQIVLGFTGFLGLMLRFIGPLTIAPTIILISITLFKTASDKGSTQWYICFMTIFFMVVFSQYLRDVACPCPGTHQKLRFFALFPVLLAVVMAWLICLILTEADVFTSDPKGWGYKARTDAHDDALTDSDWFRVPYPGQWGAPKVTVGAVCGMMAASLASIVESVGDYYACARLSGAPPPPTSAVNRGIGVEGICCLLGGAWGLVAGNTSYSENVGAIGITKVGSRFVVQVAGILLMILGCLGKFGALFVTIPDPVVGGLFYVMFGMVAAVGASNLQYVDLNSPRNLFVFGVALFFGLSVSNWADEKFDYDTGSDIANQILEVLTGTGMFVGGLMAFFLDNTIPGTKKERGMLEWNSTPSSPVAKDLTTYDLPLIQRYLNNARWTRYVPFCPGYILDAKSDDSEEYYLPSVDNRKQDNLSAETNQAFSPDSHEENGGPEAGPQQVISTRI